MHGIRCFPLVFKLTRLRTSSGDVKRRKYWEVKGAWALLFPIAFFQMKAANKTSCGDMKWMKDWGVKGSWDHLFPFGFQMKAVNTKLWRCEVKERLGSKGCTGYCVFLWCVRMERLINKQWQCEFGGRF